MKFLNLSKISWQDPRVRVLAILLLAFVVRLLGIASRPIWYDEAFSVLFAQEGPDAIFYGTLETTGARAAEEHPPAYYIFLWAWMVAFGKSIVAIRIFSVIAGLMTTWLVYQIARELFNEHVSQRSMLFFALAPFQIHYAQEIRMYSLMAMWLLLATYAYLRGARTGQIRWWILFSIASALAQYTHNLSAFYLIALVLIPIFKKDGKSLRSVIVAGVLALILYAPWLVQLPAQLAKVQQGYWVERPETAELFTLLIVYITNTPLPTTWIPIALLIALVTVTVGAIQTIRFVRTTKQPNGLIVLYLSFAPVLLLFLFSQWKPVYVERALLPSGAIFCIWLAWSLTNTNLSKLIQNTLIGGLAVASLMGVYEHITYRDFPYGPFQSLTASLKNRLEPQDVIIHSNKLTMLPAFLFDRELPQTFIADPTGSGADTLAPATQEVLGVKEETDITAATQNANHIWYIIFSRSIKEYQLGGSPSHPHITYLDSNFTFISKETWDGLEIYLYRQP